MLVCKYFICIIICLSLYTMNCEKKATVRILTDDDIKHIALEEAKKNGLVIENYDLIHDPSNGNWSSLTLKIANAKLIEDSVLKKLNFQAICFNFKSRQVIRGNNIWFFVDKMSGKLITTYSEELE